MEEQEFDGIKVDLEKIKFILITELRKSDVGPLIDDVDISLLQTFAREAIAIRVKAHVWGEEYAQKEIRYPADWIEALKARWLPWWAKKRWPVRYCVHNITAMAYYPGISPPPLGHAYDWRLMAKDHLLNEKHPEREWE